MWQVRRSQVFDRWMEALRDWPRIDAAVADLCGDAAPSLLLLLDALEDSLEQSSLARRADGGEKTS